MKKICITGGIACGKSSVGDLLRGLGVPVVEADAVCHELLGLERIIRRATACFGRRILNRQGAVDRGVLGGIIFADSRKRQKLNALLHPEARRAITAWLKAQQTGGAPLAAAVIPLAYEAGWERDWDKIICVAAPRPMQISRLRKKGFSAAEAEARISAQMAVEEKMARADCVIFNSGTRADLSRQTRLVLRNLNEKVERCHGRKK